MLITNLFCCGSSTLERRKYKDQGDFRDGIISFFFNLVHICNHIKLSFPEKREGGRKNVITLP